MRIKQIIATVIAVVSLSGCGFTKNVSSEAIAGTLSENIELSNESTFRIDFLDVGQADSALIECDNEYMLIDGGHRSESDMIYSVLKSKGVDELKYIVGTHAHEDHVGGLTATYHAAKVNEALLPQVSNDNPYYTELIDGLNRNGIPIKIVNVGETYELGSAKFTILAPFSTDVENINNTSIVLKIQYGNTSFLFTGDAEWDEEHDMLESEADLRCDLLKVGHHGSNSSSSYRFLREASPAYAVISVGKDNTYGHPTEEVLSRLRDADVEVHRTDMEGTITVTSDGMNITFQGEKKSEESIIETSGKSESEATYILNTGKSHKFHRPDCEAVSKMSEKNKKEYSGDRDAIIAQGYSPCGICKP